MRRPLFVLIGALALTACASMQPPKPPGDAYFCSPTSAIRHRGEARPEAISIRPAPKFGSCKS